MSENLLLIWNEKDKSPRYFVLNWYEISDKFWKDIVKMNGKTMSDQNSDKDDARLWKIKAAVSTLNDWVPSSVRSWTGLFLPYEKTTPINRNITDIVSIGNP